MNQQKRAMLEYLIAANGGDAVFRPSSTDRLIGCVGSIVMSARVPRGERKTSIYAAEGTAAHQVVEEALRKTRAPEEWVDRSIEVDGYKILVDDQMADAANEYLEIVESYEGPGTERYAEHKLSLSPLDPSDPLFRQNRGTADTLIVDKVRRWITVVDLKYGQGKLVARDAPQLKNYGLMALVSFDVAGGWEKIRIKVVQPRTREWETRSKEEPIEFTPQELFDGFLPTLVGAMEDSLEPTAKLTPGSWCHWCPGAGPDERGQPICPAIANQALHIARDAFAAAPLFTASSPMEKVPTNVVITPPDAPKMAEAPPGTIVLPSPLSLDPGDVATILDRREIYDTFINGVEKRAAQLLLAGIGVPGYSMQARAGHRKFIDEEKAPAALREMGLQTSALYTDPKLKSPAQIEKLLPAPKRKLLEALVDKPMGEPTLVKDTAKGAKISAGLGALPPGA